MKMGTTKIEWTEVTWNSVTGCSKISPGCQNCYAERMAKRLAGRCGYDAKQPFQITSHERRYEEPFRWRDPRMVFVCSMGDLFHEDVPIGCQLGVYETISDDRAQKHTFQVLTKRPENMADFHAAEVVGALPNLWLGVTAENQEWADKRIPILLDIPAAVRFVSLEPLLGPVDLSPWVRESVSSIDYFQRVGPDRIGRKERLDWVIVGAESGPGRRLCDTRWVEDIVRQCHAAKVPVFVKQIHTSDGRGGTVVIKNINHISNQLGYSPESLRQWPKGATP
jgi:protein gp37